MFSISADQWSKIQVLVAALDGYGPGEYVRDDLELIINKIFVFSSHSPKLNAALQRASESAHVFHKALLDLVDAEFESDEIASRTCHDIEVKHSPHRTRFAKQIKNYAEILDYDVSILCRETDAVARGRPVDNQLLQLCRRVLDFAWHEKWITIDNRGRASSKFIDLMVEIVGCANLAKLTHARDRRSVVRAVAQAREQYEAEKRDAVQSSADFDAAVDPEP
ncbi:hypothetical protein FV222_02460 [Methylobacterium sp. WL103]|uniref:hypothetical protein n=1 Tax=Methylobacterium sp. WL103 TaxID=2603891 RepID=UPI0011CC6F2E|nr:hypothetical protein [Methylobacterium sp. WL103]TXN07383.1 hypothetical protein FV222_02460 [Methylobacterium sp. WL103]